MPLTWDATKVANVEELLESDKFRMTQELCFVLGTIGINRITADNWEDVAFRIFVYEKINGACFRYWDDVEKTSTPIFITPEFVKRHIGYTTNNGNQTLAQFKTNMFRIAKEDVQYRINKLKENDN